MIANSAATGPIALRYACGSQKQRGLQPEHEYQHRAGELRERQRIGTARRKLCDAIAGVGHVQRAGHAIQHAERDQEERRTREVQHQVVQTIAHAQPVAAMQQQRIRRDQQQFEEHEQIEQIASDERAVQSHQLKLEQRPEMTAAQRVHGGCRDHAAAREHGAQREHQRAEPVELEHDAERRGPVAKRVYRDFTAGRASPQRGRDGQQRERRDDVDRVLQPARAHR
jgi:hypothetical protein